MLTLNVDELNALHSCALFKNISQKELLHLLPCLMPATQTYKENETVFREGTPLNCIYIILKGHIELSKMHFTGQKNIVTVLGKSQLFAEGVVSTSHRISPVSATTLEETTLILVSYNSIIQSCQKNCHFHHTLVYNMMRLLADKNYYLTQKMELILIKGMREKLAHYLLSQATLHQSEVFNISLNRNQLADYLNVSRPSMCRELGKMKEDGLIDYYKNTFKLLNEAELKNTTSSL